MRDALVAEYGVAGLFGWFFAALVITLVCAGCVAMRRGERPGTMWRWSVPMAAIGLLLMFWALGLPLVFTVPLVALGVANVWMIGRTMERRLQAIERSGKSDQPSG